jgi:hypothetical protein
MTTVHSLGIAGGLFAILTFVHFFVDWICQTHSEAMQKHNNPIVRARHCAIYTIGFVPFLFWFNLTGLEIFFSMNILFWSHFIEDTYVPVFLWAKYVRRPPEMINDPKNGFLSFISTPLGKILMIAVDQIIHLAFLFPIVWFALQHCK